VPEDKLRDEPSGNTAPHAWPGQVCAPQFDLHPKVVSSSGGIPDRHLPVWASRHDLNDQHAPLVTDWALAQRRAGELFIARTIILDGFSGRGL
jgi:hypothetical protein